MKKIDQIMTDHVMSIQLSTPFTVACRTFQNLSLSHLPVLDDNGSVLGMFSLRDAMTTLNNRILAHSNLNEEKVNDLVSVEEVMTNTDLVTLESEAPVGEAIKLFSLYNIHSILVFRDKKLVGILTPQDVIRSMAEVEVFS